jgi:hypothetical protein
VAIYAQAAARFHIKKKNQRGPAPVPRRHSTSNFLIPSPAAFLFSSQSAATELHVSIYAQAAARFRIIKKKNQPGPGAAAPQHTKFFDSQPRGVFVFFPISDIRHLQPDFLTPPPRRRCGGLSRPDVVYVFSI